MVKEKELGLSEAYAVETPDDNIALYRDWAKTYDETFAQSRGYNYPQHIAQVYSANATKIDSPILDVGAGTGLVAQELLKLDSFEIDAVDISPEMLAQSRSKNLYRDCIEADLSQTLPMPDNTYGAVVSAGTFTHGHVGPNALYELLRVAKVGGLFCLGVNAKAFDHYGFGSAFAALQAKGLIGPLEFVQVNFYESADDSHAEDIGYTAVFRKT